MNIKNLSILIFCLSLAAITYAMGGQPQMPKQTYALFETSQGNFTCLLYTEAAPKTVANFVGLAKGEKEWTDPRTGEKSKKPLYDGTIFHRVIADFMIQGGDPLGNGTGGPGYKFEDEIDPVLLFTNPGTLAMANSGPNTNGSQFFITVAATPWLNGKHTIFGKVTEGMDTVLAISKIPTDKYEKPVKKVIINNITIKELWMWFYDYTIWFRYKKIIRKKRS